MSVGQVSSNVTTASAWLDRVTAPSHQKSPYEAFIVDAFAREGVSRGSDVSEASLGKVAAQLGISTDGLLSAMSGKCPFGGGLQKATAKQQ